MKVEIKIPSMGESVSEAVIGNILKPSGSLVKLDEDILELETDKVNQVLHAPQNGQLTLHVKKDDVVKIDQVIGFIDTDAKVLSGEIPPSTTQKEQKQVLASAVAEPPKLETAPPKPTEIKKTEAENARVMMTDFVASIKEGPKPLLPLSEKPKITEDKVERKKMSHLRKVIAARLVESKNKAAMLTTFNEVDMSAVMMIRNREKDNFLKKYGVKLGFMSFFIKAAVSALKQIPEINAMIDGDEMIKFKSYDISVAVSTERGLMVPVIRNCDQLNFGQVEKEMGVYAKKAREGSISIDDLRGGSFTITNGGVFGSLLSTPILNPPQSAILGMHSIVKRPVVVEDEIVIRPMMYIALSYDHRIVDGKEAVLFLVHLKQSLEDPSRLLLDL